jgi:hypothetical protein
MKSVPPVKATPYLGQNFVETLKDRLFVKFVAIELQTFNEFLHRAVRLERKQRQTKRNVSPLSRVLG